MRPQQPRAPRPMLALQQAGGLDGTERELLRVRVHSQSRPAPRRPDADAETDRLAQIMASQHGQPWARPAAPREV